MSTSYVTLFIKTKKLTLGKLSDGTVCTIFATFCKYIEKYFKGHKGNLKVVEKGLPFKKWCWNNQTSVCKKMNLNQCWHTTYRKITQGRFYLNENLKLQNFKEENKRKSCDLLGKDFLDTKAKAQSKTTNK